MERLFTPVEDGLKHFFDNIFPNSTLAKLLTAIVLISLIWTTITMYVVGQLQNVLWPAVFGLILSVGVLAVCVIQTQKYVRSKGAFDKMREMVHKALAIQVGATYAFTMLGVYLDRSDSIFDNWWMFGLVALIGLVIMVIWMLYQKVIWVSYAWRKVHDLR